MEPHWCSNTKATDPKLPPAPAHAQPLRCLPLLSFQQAASTPTPFQLFSNGRRSFREELTLETPSLESANIHDHFSLSKPDVIKWEALHELIFHIYKILQQTNPIGMICRKDKKKKKLNPGMYSCRNKTQYQKKPPECSFLTLEFHVSKRHGSSHIPTPAEERGKAEGI